MKCLRACIYASYIVFGLLPECNMKLNLGSGGVVPGAKLQTTSIWLLNDRSNLHVSARMLETGGFRIDRS